MEEELQRIGLTKQEAKVYLNTLKLGVAKASNIAQKSQIKREASYYILKALQEKGFISEVIKSGVKYYNAIPPKRILGIIEEEKQKKKEAIKDLIPQLEELQKIAITQPKIEVYEGEQGFKTAISKVTEKPNQLIYAYVPEKLLEVVPYFNVQFRLKRKEKKVKIHVISDDTKQMRELKKNDKKELREMRFNDAIMKNRESAMYILPDALLIVKGNKKEQIGVYIKEPETAKLQKNIFEQIWKLSKS